ncbi:uncharacterized protein LOC141494267 [Macrotis lagotis]|uniref:uncharacterized protein LOC141494267 n=1 Tax=Macrotis lagotis TaxID=92651 RepID=UPI003D688E97
MVTTGDGESGFDSGEGSPRKGSPTSKEGQQVCPMTDFPTRGGSLPRKSTQQHNAPAVCVCVSRRRARVRASASRSRVGRPGAATCSRPGSGVCGPPASGVGGERRQASGGPSGARGRVRSPSGGRSFRQCAVRARAGEGTWRVPARRFKDPGVALSRSGWGSAAPFRSSLRRVCRKPPPFRRSRRPRGRPGLAPPEAGRGELRGRGGRRAAVRPPLPESSVGPEGRGDAWLRLLPSSGAVAWVGSERDGVGALGDPARPVVVESHPRKPRGWGDPGRRGAGLGAGLGPGVCRCSGGDSLRPRGRSGLGRWVAAGWARRSAPRRGRRATSLVGAARGGEWLPSPRVGAARRGCARRRAWESSEGGDPVEARVRGRGCGAGSDPPSLPPSGGRPRGPPPLGLPRGPPPSGPPPSSRFRCCGAFVLSGAPGLPFPRAAAGWDSASSPPAGGLALLPCAPSSASSPRPRARPPEVRASVARQGPPRARSSAGRSRFGARRRVGSPVPPGLAEFRVAPSAGVSPPFGVVAGCVAVGVRARASPRLPACGSALRPFRGAPGRLWEPASPSSAKGTCVSWVWTVPETGPSDPSDEGGPAVAAAIGRRAREEAPQAADLQYCVAQVRFLTALLWLEASTSRREGRDSTRKAKENHMTGS